MMTPGTYLRKRREAARLSINEAALRLTNLPTATGMTFHRRRAALASVLARVEADRAAFTVAQARLTQSAFPFDAMVYRRLVEGRVGPDLRICRDCGCTHFDPCVTGGQSCGWSASDPELCTFCDDVPGAVPHTHQLMRPGASALPMEAAHG